ncbi:PAS domain S-box-containing protein [Flavobacterium sp. 270]|uniref:PAS domain-containing sensor histidine kinase n=1 Tax=Flavobacterium sp. 270 TaxID=2512114 RepID=UPI0010E9C369|nr:ATP-binding protein [Flavobacterium sp. 270]TDW47841.1 PAS domain S-box-containing protein [Flavobacterium sp. 270]
MQNNLIFLQDILLHTPVPTAVYYTDDLVISFANPAMRNLWNMDEQVIGEKFADIIVDFEKDLISEKILGVIKTGIPFLASDRKLDILINGIWKPIFYNYNFTPLRNEKGIIYGVVQTCTEVTKLHEATNQIVNSDEMLSMAIDACGMGTYEIDVITNRIKISANFKKLLSIESEITVDAVLAKLHPDDQQLQKKAHKDALENGIVCYEARILQKNNSEKWIKIFGKIIKNEKGDPSTILGIVQDIQEQKEFEVELKRKIEESTLELRRSNDDLLHFANVVSHDLQEPVRKIKIFSDFLKNEIADQLPDRSLMHLNKIAHSANRMQCIIEGLLAYSTIDKSTQPVEKIFLNDLLENIKTDLELLIKEKGAILIIKDLPEIEGAPILIQQLFYNLIQNALKFTKADLPPRLIITSAIKNIDSIESIEISVKDNGIGLDPIYAEKIFAAFERLHSKDEYEGNGIGLALCRKIIDRHNGTIMAKGEKENGAEFIVTLPLKQNSKNI